MATKAKMARTHEGTSTRTQHHRVTAPQSHQAATLPGMHHRSKITQAGNTTHFDVSYLTSLGKKGADLAAAILQNCERDYATLEQVFGGLTPEGLPFIVQITSDNTGASHSSCMGTDISVGGKSGSNVDFLRSLLVAEADEVFMANFGHGWNCGASNGEGLSRVLANDIYKGVEPADFISSDVWLSLNPRPNFVDHTEPRLLAQLRLKCHRKATDSAPSPLRRDSSKTGRSVVRSVAWPRDFYQKMLRCNSARRRWFSPGPSCLSGQPVPAHPLIAKRHQTA